MYLIMYLMAFIQTANAEAFDALEKATPFQNWQFIAGAILPGVLAVIIQSKWSRTTQTIVSMAASLLVSAVAALLSDPSIVVPEIVIRGLGLFALTITFYYGAWKPTQLAPKIEASTNL